MTSTPVNICCSTQASLLYAGTGAVGGWGCESVTQCLLLRLFLKQCISDIQSPCREKTALEMTFDIHNGRYLDRRSFYYLVLYSFRFDDWGSVYHCIF